MIFLLSDANQRQLKLNSVAAVKLFFDINKTNYDARFEEKYWRTEGVYVVENKTLEKKFNEYRAEQLKKVKIMYLSTKMLHSVNKNSPGFTRKNMLAYVMFVIFKLKTRTMAVFSHSTLYLNKAYIFLGARPRITKGSLFVLV